MLYNACKQLCDVWFESNLSLLKTFSPMTHQNHLYSLHIDKPLFPVLIICASVQIYHMYCTLASLPRETLSFYEGHNATRTHSLKCSSKRIPCFQTVQTFYRFHREAILEQAVINSKNQLIVILTASRFYENVRNKHTVHIHIYPTENKVQIQIETGAIASATIGRASQKFIMGASVIVRDHCHHEMFTTVTIACDIE